MLDIVKIGGRKGALGMEFFMMSLDFGFDLVDLLTKKTIFFIYIFCRIKWQEYERIHTRILSLFWNEVIETTRSICGENTSLDFTLERREEYKKVSTFFIPKGEPTGNSSTLDGHVVCVLGPLNWSPGPSLECSSIKGDP